ncbi:MAG TPA: response regulator transcription factor [Bryobacterales bacterium]|nr:response regulator transcription factor [Bryobacterales bacterium]
MIQVIVCETQPIVVEGLKKTLHDAKDLRLLCCESSPKALLEKAIEESPKVCLIDKALGTSTVFQLISDLKTQAPDTEPVLWASEITEVESFRALQVGARGILKKTLPIQVLLDCIRTVAKGNIWIESSISNQFVGFINRRSTPRLTPREDEILNLVMRGMKNKQIADSLTITTGTVKVHLMHIFEKTGVKDRFELALYGRKLRGYNEDYGGELSPEASADDAA